MSSSLKYVVGLHGLRSTTAVAARSTKLCNYSLLNTASKLQQNQCVTGGALVCNKSLQNCHKQRNKIDARNFCLSTQHSTKDSSFHRYQIVMDAPPGVFKGSVDRFNGVTIESSTEFKELENFAEKLEKSLHYWITNKRRAIWFNVKTEHSEWVPHLTRHGFDFHHAKNGFVVLVRWLPADEYANIPVHAHTMLGVGGLVVNKNNEVLVVCERYSLIPNSWKLPGGYAEPKENIIDAGIREVREETGIECEFNTVISIRHSHGGIFGCSDIYCVVALTPKTLELTRDQREIAKLQWMPVQEYLKHPNVHETNRHFMRCYLDYQKRGIRFTCEIGLHQVLKKKYCLYFMKPIEDEEVREHKKGEMA